MQYFLRILIPLALWCFNFGFSNAQTDWEDPSVFEKGQEPPHTTLMPFNRQAEAIKMDRKSSPNHFTLNGSWQFHWAENPEKVPDNFYQASFDRQTWDQIKVPSNWQMEGFGYPIFRNIGQAFNTKPPGVPKDFNPVGSYYRTFQVPRTWRNKEIFLHFEGVHSAFYVWINEEMIGYNQGGMEPAEFNITPFLKRGENHIAIQVLRYSDGSYLEDQDTWRLSGIYRDVYLMATPKVHVQDFYVTTDLDEAYTNATLEFSATLKNYQNRRINNYLLRLQLYDERNRPVLTVPEILPIGILEPKMTSAISHTIPIVNPKKWSAELPNLYTLTIELLNNRPQTIEILSQRVGFREVEVKNQAIYINGVPIKFNGVNSHMMHPETGHSMDVETMRKDLTLMKQFNINCVRTSHYPPNVEYLDLADEIGMYIFDETGDEAHAYIYLSHDPDWKNQYLDRMRKMVYRDRNHPSVVVWSAGNESGPGENICALIAEGKKIDPSRPAWMYGGNRDEDPQTNPIKCEDIVGPRYLQPFILEQRFAKSTDPRPSFMDEYIAVTGNALGGLDEYWDLIYKYPRLTGGAIWDWISPGIRQPVMITPDEGSHQIQCALMNRAHLMDGKFGKAVKLSGRDDWIEVYRDPALDLSGDEITLSFWVRPTGFNGHGYFLTKGNFQFGVTQTLPDSIEFYLHTDKLNSLKCGLPEHWFNNWHLVTGIYNGEEMWLFIDQQLVGKKRCSGNITNGPYPVQLGKSAHIEDSHLGGLCQAELDKVRIFDEVIPIQDLQNETSALKSRALLWLDFEQVEQQGDFYSIGLPGRTYGLIWPDRTVQPELWQLKKSPQPVKVRAIDLDKGIFEIRNRHHFKNLNALNATWKITANENVLQSGNLNLDIMGRASKIVQIDYQKPPISEDLYYQLEFSFTLPQKTHWADAGHEVAWDQFVLSEFRQRPSENNPELLVEDQEDLLIIKGSDFIYQLNKNTGLIQSMEVGGNIICDHGPKFNVWRAPLANELDAWGTYKTKIGHTKPWMGKDIANGWLSLGIDRLEHSLNHCIYTIESNSVTVIAETSTHANNFATGFRVSYHYIFNGSGHITMTTSVTPFGHFTSWIPKVGLQMKMPKSFRNISWWGRGPYETYPDRKTGAKIGLFHSTIDEEFVPYIIPQDYGNKADVSWASITDEDGFGLLVKGDEQFNTSLQKYDTDHLTRAFYPFQLIEDDHVTLNLDHKMSGVGGTAISILNPYRVLADQYTFTFHLIPTKP